MNHPDLLPTLGMAAAFVAGLTGSAHCLAMCGGMAGALGMRARAQSASTRQALLHSILYHLGRASGYAAIGALAGLAGALGWRALEVSRAETAARVASGLLLVLIALRLLVRWNALQGIEKLGARLWRSIQPVARRRAQRPGNLSSFVLGVLWGWLPCGLVYSILLLAAASANPLHGAAVMAMFGLGTLPAMLMGTLAAPSLRGLASRPWTRQASGLLLLSCGAWMMAVPLLTSHALHVH